MDLSSQQFSALAADAQYFEAAPPINMLPISSARLAIGGARALSYAGGKVVAQHVFVIVGFQVPPTTQNVVGGQWLESSTEQWIEVHNPATNQVGGLERIKKDPTLLPWQVVTKVPQSTQAEMENAVESAKSAGRTWSRSSPMARCSSPLTLLLASSLLKSSGFKDMTFRCVNWSPSQLAIPYNTVKYNRANFSSLSGNKLCSNTSSLSNSTWMTLPS